MEKMSQLDDWPVNTPLSVESDSFVSAVDVEILDFFETSGLFIDIAIPEDPDRAQTLLGDRA